MAILTSYDWESDTFTHHAENAARQAWREAVQEIAERAKQTLPDCAGRVDRAVQIVLNHDVELLEDGKANLTQSLAKGVAEIDGLEPIAPWKDQVSVNATYPGMMLHEGESVPGKGDTAPFPVLGLVEGQHPAFQVHVRPAQRQELHLPRTCSEG